MMLLIFDEYGEFQTNAFIAYSHSLLQIRATKPGDLEWWYTGILVEENYITKDSHTTKSILKEKRIKFIDGTKC